MSPQRHQIRRQIYEVTVSNQTLGMRLQNELSRLQRLDIEAIIDRCCTELSAPDRLHRLGRIEVDLGEFAMGNFENDLGERLSLRLRDVLGEHIREDEKVSRMIGNDPTIEAKVELISHFAMTGSLPFWADPSNAQVVDEAVAALQSQSKGSSRLRDLVVHDLATAPGALERLARHVDASRLRILLEELIPPPTSVAAERSALVWELIAMARTTWTAVPRSTIWAEALRVSAVGESRNENTVAFSKELIARMALAVGATYRGLVDELWTKLKPAHGPNTEIGLTAVVLALRHEMGITEMGASPPGPLSNSAAEPLRGEGEPETLDALLLPPLHGALQRNAEVERGPGGEVLLVNSQTVGDITIPKVEEGVVPAEITFPKDGDAFAAAVITFFNDGDAFAGVAGVPSTVRKAFAGAADAPPTVRDAFADAANAPSTVHDAFADAANAPSMDGIAFADDADGPPTVKKLFAGAVDAPSTVRQAFSGAVDAPLTVRDAFTGAADAPSTVYDAFTDAPKQSPRVSVRSLHTKQTMPSFPAARRSPARHEDPDEIYLTTAGLVLLWPFIATFFDRIGLLAPPEPDKPPRFFDHASRCRGALLLHYLATAQNAPPEYRLPLEKILCGLHLQEPFNPGNDFNDLEILETESVLSAVIAHAPNLGDMTIEAFRNAFLCRRGVLSMRDDTWLLRVEKDAFDVVLGGLPWTISWIRLPFMAASLAVEWLQ